MNTTSKDNETGLTIDKVHNGVWVVGNDGARLGTVSAGAEGYAFQGTGSPMGPGLRGQVRYPSLMMAALMLRGLVSTGRYADVDEPIMETELVDGSLDKGQIVGQTALPLPAGMFFAAIGQQMTFADELGLAFA